MSSIIKSEENGIEFYTIAATGESGMSQSGLAILCGISPQAISKLDKSLTTKSSSETLKPWVGKVKTLTTNSEYKNATIYSASFCAAVIRHYAYNGNQTAQFSLDKFAEIGINTWIQGITHWDSAPVDLQNVIATAQRFLNQHLEKYGLVEQRVNDLEELVHQHDREVDRLFHPDGTYFSIRVYASKVKRKLSKKEASDLGRAATKMSRQQGVTIDKLEDSRYGAVNIYHESVLSQVFTSPPPSK
jgi:hypothetical protein